MLVLFGVLERAGRWGKKGKVEQETLRELTLGQRGVSFQRGAGVKVEVWSRTWNPLLYDLG